MSVDKLNIMITLENEKEKQYWDTWVKIYKELNKR